MRDPYELRQERMKAMRKNKRRRGWRRNVSDTATVGIAAGGCLFLLLSVVLPLVLMAAGAYWLFTH